LNDHGYIDPRRLYAAFQDNLIQCDEISKGALSRFCGVLEELGDSNDSLGDYFKFKAEKKSFQLIKSSYFTYRNYDKKLVLKVLEENENWLDALFAFQNSVPVYDLPFSSINSLDFQGLINEWSKSLIELVKKIVNVVGLFIGSYLSSLLLVKIEKFLLAYFILNFYIPFLVSMLFILYLNYRSLSADELTVKFWCFWAAAVLLFAPAFTFIMNVFLILYQILPPLISRASSFFYERPWSIHDIKVYLSQVINQYFAINSRFFNNLFCLVIWDLPTRVFFEWPLMFGGMIVSIILRSVETAKQSLFPKHAMNDAWIRVENTIFRLQMMDDISARQKGKILQNLWSQITKDLTENSELTLDSTLNKKYSIHYKGQEHEYSFNEIAEIKRIKGQEFNLMPKNRWYALFPTTSKSSIHDLSRNLIANPV
jgi:hypothetical protein